MRPIDADDFRRKLYEHIAEKPYGIPVWILDLLDEQPAAWISCAERLPDGECVAISMLKGPQYKQILVGWIAEAEDWETGYVCEGDGVMLPNVTHWMQPGTPKEGE